MKKILSLTIIALMFGSSAFCANYQSTRNYKLTEYNSKGQKVGYTKVYYKGDKSNVKKVEQYSTKGYRTKLYR